MSQVEASKNFFIKTDDADSLLKDLNDAQREAVTHVDGPLLVLAGPGSGKTRVVTHRVAWLLRSGVRDYQIAALTFTNKAADEMKKRLQTMAPGARVWIGTFHRFCASLLRYYARFVGLEENYAIYDADQSQKLLESVVPKSSLPIGVDIPKIVSGISWAKNSLVSSSEYCATGGSLLGKVVEEAYPLYQAALKKANAVDFDDLLFHIAVILRQNPEIRAQLDSRFRYILVDEYQDTNLVQYVIARALSVDFPNLAATGDPDQSIYGWRGANINNILNFEKDFPSAKVVRLEQNYRSVKSVLRVADCLIKHNVYRKDKNLYTENKEGLPPRILVYQDQVEEAETIAAEIAAEIASGKRKPQDYAIFYRMNALSRNLEYALKRYGVPYQLVRGLEFFNRKEIKDVCSYLQLIYNPNDVISFKRVVNLPSRGIGNVSLARLECYAEEYNVSLLEAARSAARIGGLSTKVQKALLKFVSLIDHAAEGFAKGEDMEVVVSLLLDKSKYLDYLKTSSAKTEEDEQRIDNVQEFLTELREFDRDFAQLEQETPQDQFFGRAPRVRDRLGTFLEQIALVSDVDAWNANESRVSLMTLHAAKGLEFPVVYLVALEDGVLPHERSKDVKRQLEEERRLLFVGITRAKEELRLSRTRYREFRGSYSPAVSSRFIFDFPEIGIDRYGSLDSWLGSLQKKAATDPNAHIVVPRFFERKEGVSQRLALWEDVSSSFFMGGGDSDVNRHVPSSARGERQIKPADFADADECVDPEPENDYSQEVRRDDQFVDETSSTDDLNLVYDEDSQSSPALYADFDDADNIVFDFDDDQNARRRPTAKRNQNAKRSQKEIMPGALTSGSTLENRSNMKERRESIDSPPKSIVVNSFVQHKKYGVGVVKEIKGPSFDRIAKISFLSGIGELELPLKDPDLALVAIGRRGKST